ncbi:hypothetical protein CR513_05315, partial [Mucuna pruriens]
MFSVCLCAQFQADCRESHLILVKSIFIYLKRTINLSLYFKQSDKYRLVGYCEANYAGDRIERKNTNKAKPVEIKHHLIRYYIQKGIFDIKFISTNEQLTDIFTKSHLEDKLVHVRDILVAMGLNLIVDLKACGILPFFENKQSIHQKLIRELWTNYDIKQHCFGKNNVAPMRLETIHLTLPSVIEEDKKPTKANLDYQGVLKGSVQTMNKRKAQTIANQGAIPTNPIVFPSVP